MLKIEGLPWIAAPMVGGSDPAFRALCLRHGATAAFTEMLYADRIVSETDYAKTWLAPVESEDRVCVQLCGHDPEVLGRACRKLMDTCGEKLFAVDLNLGCPQQRAKDAQFGSFLLGREHWETVFACVRAMETALHKGAPSAAAAAGSAAMLAKSTEYGIKGVAHVQKEASVTVSSAEEAAAAGPDALAAAFSASQLSEPDEALLYKSPPVVTKVEPPSPVSEPPAALDATPTSTAKEAHMHDLPLVCCKIRLCEGVEELADGLFRSGCQCLTVHGRTAPIGVQSRHRRKGPADLGAIRRLVQVGRKFGALVITNGNVSCAVDAVGTLAATGADGVMSAEGILTNPGLFREAAGITGRPEVVGIEEVGASASSIATSADPSSAAPVAASVDAGATSSCARVAGASHADGAAMGGRSALGAPHTDRDGFSKCDECDPPQTKLPQLFPDLEPEEVTHRRRLQPVAPQPAPLPNALDLMREYVELCELYPPVDYGYSWKQAALHVEWMLGKRGHGRKRHYVLLPGGLVPGDVRRMADGCECLEDLRRMVRRIAMMWEPWLDRLKKGGRKSGKKHEMKKVG